MRTLHHLMRLCQLLIAFGLLSSCQDEPKDNKIVDSEQSMTRQIDSLVQALEDVQRDLKNLQADTAEGHQLVVDLQNLKVKYDSLLNATTALVQSGDTAGFGAIAARHKELAEEFNRLHLDKDRFQNLVDENNSSRAEVISAQQKIDSLSDENNSLKTEANKRSGDRNANEELRKEIDSLRNELTAYRDSVKSIKDMNAETQAKLEEMEQKLADKESAYSKLDDVQPVFTVDIIPHRKSRPMKVKPGNRFPHNNIDTVQVQFESQKAKPDSLCRPITIYVQYIVDGKTQNPKHVMLDGIDIEYSDSILLKPGTKRNLYFDIYKWKLSAGTHELRMYHRNCDMNKPDHITFTTY